jgi:hypothetical protein
VEPELESARWEWAATARQRLRAVTTSVDRLRQSFASGVPGVEEATAVAEDVIGACAALTEWLGGAHAPRGLGKAEGELAAAAGVYKNAAFAFRSLEDADPDQHEAREVACATMLEQGDEHVEVFAATLLRKLGLP